MNWLRRLFFRPYKLVAYYPGLSPQAVVVRRFWEGEKVKDDLFRQIRRVCVAGNRPFYADQIDWERRRLTGL